MNGWELFVKAYAGGLLIGLSSTLLLMLNGRIAGISGIVASSADFYSSSAAERHWRWLFIGGMLASAVLWQWLQSPFAIDISVGTPLLILAGLLVGFGTRLGSGCTSGHGVCGIGRRSARSIAATITFILSGAVTVVIVRLMGAAL